MDDTTFRSQYPAFTDQTKYTPAAVAMYIADAVKLLRAERWNDMLDRGIALYVAHHMAIDARDNAVVAAGGIPGATPGVLNSKTVDRVSASYDVSRVTMDDAGYWNATSYGLRFWSLMLMMGAGGIQL